MGSKQEYLHNVASSVMGQLGIVSFFEPWGSEEIGCDTFPRLLWNCYGSKVTGVLRKMGPSARGRIAACGVSMDHPGVLSFWKVTGGGGLGIPDKEGDDVLTLLASYVVVAAIVDIIRAQAQRMCEGWDDQRSEHELMEERARGIYGSMAG